MISTEVLEKAVLSLEEGISLYENCDGSHQMRLALRDAVIQRFEYTYELSWKLVQRWISENVSPEAAAPISRKELFRTAARLGLIDEPQNWFLYHQARNLSVHTYNESNAADVFAAALKFAADAGMLAAALRRNEEQ